MRACPYCAEQIQDAAILCRYCGKGVTPVAPGDERPGSSPGSSLERSVVRMAVLALLLVLMGVALLYAYRAQSPSAATVPVSQAISQIQNGQVRVVTISSDQATLDLRDGTHEGTVVGTPTDGFEKILTDYNASHDPSQQISWSKQQGAQTFGIIGPVLLSLLPVVLVGLFFLFLVQQMRRR